MRTYNKHNAIMQSHFEVAIKTSDKNCILSACLVQRAVERSHERELINKISLFHT